MSDIQRSVDPEQKGPVRVFGTAVIDGVQIPVRTVEHGARRTVERLVEPGRIDRFQLSIDGARVAAGTHWAALVFWQANGHRFPGWSFAIVKNGSRRERASGGCPFRKRAADRDDM